MFRRALILLTHLTAAILPMLAGWGLRDLHGFLANQVRALLLVAILAGAAAVLYLKIDLNPLRNGSLGSHRESWTLAFLAVASLALLWFLPFADRQGIAVLSIPGVRWVGLLLTC